MNRPAVYVVCAGVPEPQPPIPESALTWVRWNDQAHVRHPEFREAISQFDPVHNAAGHASADWLRNSGLSGESIAYLAITLDPLSLVGFYALTMSQVELTSAHRKRLDLVHPTQGAVLVTHLARSARHAISGLVLIEDAIGVATELAEQAGATVLALDPFDAATDTMWRTRFNFRASRTTIRHDDAPLRRLYLPLRSPGTST